MSVSANLKTIIRSTVDNDMMFLRSWPCTVVSQSGQTVDIIPDSSKLPHMQAVPIKSGVPGIEVTVKPNARAHVLFSDGDPGKPFVCVWEPSEIVGMRLAPGGDDSGVARTGDAIVGFFAADDIAKICAAIVSGIIGSASFSPVALSAALSSTQISGVVVSGSTKVTAS